MENEQIREIINMLADGCKDYVPKVAEYEIHSSTMWAIVWAFIVALSVISIIAVYGCVSKKKKLGIWCDDNFALAVYVIGAILAIIGLVIFFIEIDDIYVAKYLPEKMLMQYIKAVLENGL